jgi:hypothetical protein
MLSIDAKLDYETLKKICDTGHSRVPVYEEVNVPVSELYGTGDGGNKTGTTKLKKILGILLVKQCLLLDPKGMCCILIRTEADDRIHVRRYASPQDSAEQGSLRPQQ